MSRLADDLVLAQANPAPVRVQPNWVGPRPKLPVSVGLRAFMVILVYFAIAFLAGRAIWDTGSTAGWICLGVWAGLGFALAGVWMVTRLRRYALLGWLAIFLGEALASSALLGGASVGLPIPLTLLGLDLTAELPIPLPGPLAWPAILIFIGVVLYVRAQHRQSQQGGLLWVLALASRRDLPLAPGVEAFAQEQHGSYRERVHAVADLLGAGTTLGTALDAVPKVASRDASVLIRVGEATGTLSEALRTAATLRAGRHHALRDVIGRLTYLIGAAVVLLALIGGFNWFLLPRYTAICRDFGLTMDPETDRLSDALDFAEENAAWVARALLLIGAYLGVAVSLRGWAGLPVVGRLFWLRHQALVLRCLALTAQANRPIDATLSLLGRYAPSRFVRRRVRRAAGETAQGVSGPDALRYARLITKAEANLLDAATRAGNLPWAMTALADSGERRFADRLQLATQIVFVVSLLGLAAAVLFVTLALYLPLVDIIEGLAA